jgi:glucose/arabinose dehydrogenase
MPMTAMRRRVLSLATLGALVWGATVSGGGVAAGAAAPRAETLPSGFTDTAIATIARPIALAATPDGRILVVNQAGVIRVIKNGALLATPALDISANVCAHSERGLLGIAVDANFAANGYVYVYYTFKKFPKCKRDIADVPVNRVSRFKMKGDVIKPASEKILIDNMMSFHGNHNAGDLGFGNDGLLYVSVGDGGCDYTVGTTACDGRNTIAQALNTLQGKVLRITRNGGIPKTNPFVGAGTGRCNQGAIAAGQKCEEIYLSGLRNPFRFAFDPNSTRTRLFVNDVGQANWEEIDKATSGANYGWSVREGPCATGSLTDCGPPPAGMTNPVFAYSHAATDCGAITGGAFVPNGLWGAGFDGGYLYADYICNKIFLMVPDGTGGWTSSLFASGLAVGGPETMLFAPHGTKTVLYYTTYTANSNTGEVHVIDQT